MSNRASASWKEKIDYYESKFIRMTIGEGWDSPNYTKIWGLEELVKSFNAYLPDNRQLSTRELRWFLLHQRKFHAFINVKRGERKHKFVLIPKERK